MDTDRGIPEISIREYYKRDKPPKILPGYGEREKTSSSDGQKFAFRSKVLHQTYRTKFNDLALEFYSFVADNFALFYSMPVECTDRDAPFVLDELLYQFAIIR